MYLYVLKGKALKFNYVACGEAVYVYIVCILGMCVFVYVQYGMNHHHLRSPIFPKISYTEYLSRINEFPVGYEHNVSAPLKP